MITTIARLWIRDYENFSLPEVKAAYAKLCSGTGIVINLLLFLIKFICGTFCGSTAIVADSFNNLSDAATTAASFFGFMIAEIGAGKGHPFGHGRFEWLISIFSSTAVVFMGITLAQNSVHAVRFPAAVKFNLTVCVILAGSVLTKFYMYFYNSRIGKKIDSSAVKAAAADSISDMISTAAILVSLIVQSVTGREIDGWCGLLVSVFIMVSGGKALFETVGRLLGRAEDPELYDRILKTAESYPEVFGVNSLAVHDYGMGRLMISMHLEGTAEEQRPGLSAAACDIEHRLYSEMGCDTAIQIDILDIPAQNSSEIRRTADQVFQKLAVQAELQECRAVRAGKYTDLVLGVSFSRRMQKREKEIRQSLEEAFGVLHGDWRVRTYFMIRRCQEEKGRFRN